MDLLPGGEQARRRVAGDGGGWEAKDDSLAEEAGCTPCYRRSLSLR